MYFYAIIITLLVSHICPNHFHKHAYTHLRTHFIYIYIYNGIELTPDKNTCLTVRKASNLE